VRLVNGPDGNTDIFLSPPISAIIREYCAKAPEIPRLLEGGQALTIDSVFKGDETRAAEFKGWIEGVRMDQFPFVEFTRSHRECNEIVRRLAAVRVVKEKKVVPQETLLRRQHNETGDDINSDRPVISIADNESFGCVGIVVGSSKAADMAIVILTTEDPRFTALEKIIPRPAAVVTSLNALRQI
jgi:hypothetical protein